MGLAGAVGQEGTAHRGRGEAVEHALRREIVLGTLAPGAVLRELDLAQRFNCAQGTIREALMRLSEEGLVMRRARRDTHVALANPEDAGELLRIRYDIECRAAARVMRGRAGDPGHERAPADLARDLDAILQDMRLAALKGDEYALLEHDCRFHLRLFSSVGMPVVEPVLLRCLVHTQRYKVLNTAPEGRDLLATANRHLAIIDALDTGVPEALVEALAHHIATIADFGPQMIAPGTGSPT